MADTNSTHLDGDTGYSNPVASVTIATVAYIVESATPKMPTTVAERRNGKGVPSAQAIQDGFDTLSLTLQLAEDDTALPPRRATFTGDFKKAGSAQTWIVSDVGGKYGQSEYQMVDIEARLQINAPAT